MTNSNNIRRSVVGLLFLASMQVTAAAETKVNGRLERIEAIRTLRVWGTPHEMGYAHGFLLADDIAEDIEDVVSGFFPDSMKQYLDARQTLLSTIKLPARAEDELKGVFEGIIAAKGKSPELQGLSRQLQIEDLVFYNALDVIRAFGCSGFTVWGDHAGDAGVVTGRNFDFSPFSKRVLADQMLIVRQPAGRHQVVSIAWPGYIGAYTGFNELGVAAFMHDGNAPTRRAPSGQHAPLAIVLVQILETVEPDTAHTLAGAALRNTTTPYSYLVRFVIPRPPGAVEFPATVFRLDPAGLGATPIGGDRCITTNHYVGADFKVSDSSARRFKTIKGLLGDGGVTSRRAWSALKAVAAGGKAFSTLHSVLYFPEQRRMELAFATWAKKLVPATGNPPVEITFEKLFDSSR